MKNFLLILPLSLWIGCATQPASPVVVHTPVQPPPPGLRHAETLKAYHVGRTVDARNRLHERHTLYRVETGPRWNLYGSEPPGVTGSSRAFYYLPQTNDWIRAEYHRQRETTQRLLLEANRLAQIYEPFQKTLSDMSEVAENQLWMRTRLSHLEHQIKTLTEELQRPPLSLTTNLGSRP